MFQILKDPHFDFMGKRKMLLPVSFVLVVAAAAVLLFNGLNLGIEFTGGTELQVKYADTPDLPEIRRQLGAAGLGTPLVTTIGDPADHEVYIRLASRGTADESEDPTVAVLAALRGVFDYLNFLERLAPRIGSVHLWNTRGPQDYAAYSHLPVHPSQQPGMGWVDVGLTIRIIRDSNPDAVFIFEHGTQFPPPFAMNYREGVSWVREMLGASGI